MSMMDGMTNAWALYWAPGIINEYGQETPTTFSVIRVNWKSGAGRNLNQSGETYTVNHTVYSASEMKEGGYLKRLDYPKTTTAAAIATAEVATTYPRDGQIRNAGFQQDLDTPSDKVYQAML